MDEKRFGERSIYTFSNFSVHIHVLSGLLLCSLHKSSLSLSFSFSSTTSLVQDRAIHPIPLTLYTTPDYIHYTAKPSTSRLLLSSEKVPTSFLPRDPAISLALCLTAAARLVCLSARLPRRSGGVCSCKSKSYRPS